jgi:alpha-D-ribose 1-methylphosphonate 5-triphosphate synthase subunit PhnG
MTTAPDLTDEQAERRCWMSVLARADRTALDAAWKARQDHPDFAWVRRPETGMTMVRGRAGGSGRRFNLGEMTVTRCALRLDGDILGVAYVRGRDHRHCELAALFDAMLQDPKRRDDIKQDVIRPLARAHGERRQEAERKTAATRVDFFTMATGREAP